MCHVCAPIVLKQITHRVCICNDPKGLRRGALWRLTLLLLHYDNVLSFFMFAKIV